MPLLFGLLGLFAPVALAGTTAVACSRQAPDSRASLVPEVSTTDGSTPDPAPSPPAPSPPAPSPPAPSPPAPSSSAPPSRGPAAPIPTNADAGPRADRDDAPARVRLVTIGMHVGGGPYDEPTKEPMKRSVEPRFAELARCWKHVEKQKHTDVGVDLVIEAGGGRAKVSNPRSTGTGEGFLPCVVAFFESVEFLKPNNGRTVVIYSVRFTP
jgi:hypothetical protein